MPKSGGEINKNFYKYASKEYDENNNIVDVRFYITQFDLIEKFPMSRVTLQRYFREKKRIKKYKNIEFEKVRIPVYKRVVNDVFSHNILDYNSDESSADYSEYETYLEKKNDKKYVEEVLDGENGEKIPIYTYN